MDDGKTFFKYSFSTIFWSLDFKISFVALLLCYLSDCFFACGSA